LMDFEEKTWVGIRIFDGFWGKKVGRFFSVSPAHPLSLLQISNFSRVSRESRVRSPVRLLFFFRSLSGFLFVLPRERRALSARRIGGAVGSAPGLLPRRRIELVGSMPGTAVFFFFLSFRVRFCCPPPAARFVGKKGRWCGGMCTRLGAAGAQKRGGFDTRSGVFLFCAFLAPFFFAVPGGWCFRSASSAVAQWEVHRACIREGGQSWWVQCPVQLFSFFSFFPCCFSLSAARGALCRHEGAVVRWEVHTPSCRRGAHTGCVRCGERRFFFCAFLSPFAVPGGWCFRLARSVGGPVGSTPGFVPRQCEKWVVQFLVRCFLLSRFANFALFGCANCANFAMPQSKKRRSGN
jgi:hypothetical protein